MNFHVEAECANKFNFEFRISKFYFLWSKVTTFKDIFNEKYLFWYLDGKHVRVLLIQTKTFAVNADIWCKDRIQQLHKDLKASVSIWAWLLMRFCILYYHARFPTTCMFKLTNSCSKIVLKLASNSVIITIFIKVSKFFLHIFNGILRTHTYSMKFTSVSFKTKIVI